MESHEVFLVILLLIGGGFIVQKMFKSIATVVGITLAIAFAYLILTGQAGHLVNPGVKTVFDKNDVFFLYDSYCCEQCNDRERPMCTCFIEEVYYEVLQSIPHGDADYYDQNRDLLRPITKKVLSRKKQEIDQCLDANKTTRFNIVEDIEGVIEFYKKSREIRKGVKDHLHIKA